MDDHSPDGLAKLTWLNPANGQAEEFVLTEGATAIIGRLAGCEISVPDQHVSRQHAVISWRDGVFMINDMGSANGTFVNDKRIEGPFPLASGDVIRLYKPEVKFTAATDDDRTRAAEGGTLITAMTSTGKGKLIITTGPQEGNTIPLLLNKLTVGRATPNANWEIALQDPSVSRPHARLEANGGKWFVYDMGSSNGTLVNGVNVTETGHVLKDGDMIAFGTTLTLFRVG